MNRFYATFIPGLQDLIADIVRERLPDAAILNLFDGAILFETGRSYDTLNFFCFNNIFACISVAETGAEAHIAAIVRNSAPQGPDALAIMARNSKKFRTFRVVISQENKLAAIDEKLRLAAEQYIARISGLKVDRTGPDAEFWFLYRSEGFSFFMKRLTLRPSWEKSLHPGELPPPLVWMLCHLGNLKHGDIVLDPFCGYGAIPSVALKHFHITQCIACDSNEKAAAYTAARFKDRLSPFTMHKTDFRSLASLLPEKSSIDAIITDPPWGEYRENQNARLSIPQFYEEMFNIFDTLLKADGRIVILGGRSDNAVQIPLINAAQGRFALRRNIPILLSGKKAAIFCFGRE
ncbi:MAG: methyltransferase [Treponema sp.]|nr:methyltransferase [Treponema sp.]